MTSVGAWRPCLATALLALVLGPNSNTTAAQDVNYMVPEPFFVIAQPTSNTCWATAATMLKSWKAGQLLSIDSVMQTAGDPFPILFSTNQPLGRSDKVKFLQALALTAEPPASIGAQGLESKLRLWGPLWITTAEPDGQSFSIHARVLIGIMGDGSADETTLTIADPADGAKHLESLGDFIKKLETVARGDYGDNADVRPLIVHL